MELDVEVMTRLRSGTGRMSWLMVVNYMSGAEWQLERIVSAKAAMDGLETAVERSEMSSERERQAQDTAIKSFLDAHFYLVCLEKVEKLLKRLVQAESDETLDEVWLSAAPVFSDVHRGRNFFEHLDERVERFGPDLGRFTGGSWEFQEESYPISGEDLRRVEAAVGRLAETVRDLPDDALS
jgi:hypothetical protein